jgi:ribosomal peptide maturation radical SAM protein 1
MDVVLVVMPFADIGRPAIGVSLLKQVSVRAGFPVAIEYANLRLAEQIGPDLYQKIASSFPPDLLVGEWLFADEVFGDDIPPAEDYVDNILARYAGPETVRAIVEVRKRIRGFVDDCARRIARLQPRVVGFTSTFHQTCASLAAARRLKALPMPPVVVMGGANCEAEMGEQIAASFPWIDHVWSGEGEAAFPDLLDAILTGRSASPALAVGPGHLVSARSPIRNLDDLPYPDYDDYFEQLERTSMGRAAVQHVLVETSRGCWWGAKHHCTFCGLNGETMAFRSKSPERAYAEILFLARKYGLNKVAAVDNILDLRYVDTLFPCLESGAPGLEVFYEVKSNLRLDQLLRMRRGGLREIQPGIESLSDEVLALMDKGVSALQNLQLMRWCEEVGIGYSWNLIGGFPGESPSEYEEMARLIPLLTHLTPPCSCAQLRLDRFSPFHARPQAFGMRNLRAARAYFYTFPLERREMNRLACFFDFDYADGRQPDEYLSPVQAAVQRWWDTRSSGREAPRLDALFTADGVVVTDTRGGTAKTRRLDDLEERILLLCDTARSLPGLLREGGLGDRAVEVSRALESFLSHGLVVQHADRFLTLAVLRNRPPALVKHERLTAPAQAAVPQPLRLLG